MLLIQQKQLEQFAIHFYNVTGINIIIYDENKNVLYSNHHPGCIYYEEFFLNNPKLLDMCHLSDLKYFDLAAETKSTQIYRCHMNLTKAIIPILANDILIGYIKLSRVLNITDKKSIKARAKSIAQEHFLDEKKILQLQARFIVVNLDMLNSIAELMNMCIKCMWFEKVLSVREDELITLLKSYINEHMSEELTVPALCKYLCVSKSTLYKLSISYFKMGISDYIKSVRIGEALKLLKKGAIPIYQIAEKVGIPDANYFSKEIKKASGLSPRQYIKCFISGSYNT